MAPRRILFLCNRNRLRGPAAEQVFSAWPKLEVDSAGLADDANVVLTTEPLDCVDLVAVMEAVTGDACRRTTAPNSRASG